MDKQRTTDSLPADLSAFREELTHLHSEAKTAATQRSSEGGNDQGGIVVRGR